MLYVHIIWPYDDDDDDDDDDDYGNAARLGWCGLFLRLDLGFAAHGEARMLHICKLCSRFLVFLLCGFCFRWENSWKDAPAPCSSPWSGSLRANTASETRKCSFSCGWVDTVTVVDFPLQSFVFVCPRGMSLSAVSSCLCQVSFNTEWARVGAFGCGTALQAWMSPVRFPKETFFRPLYDPIVD